MKIEQLLKKCLSGGLVFAMLMTQSVPVKVKASSDHLLSTGGVIDYEEDDEGHVVISKQSGYISELKTVYDSDESTAKKKLEDDGYTVIDQDVNYDSDIILSSKKAVYLGYKTTNKASEAIRDVIALGQNDEYVIMDYDEILKNQYTDYAQIEDDFNVMITEFQQRYAAGSEMAKDAYGLLNAFYEDTSGLLLGDWFLQVTPAESTADNISSVMELITQVSQLGLAAMELDLAFGLSTGEKATENYLTRLCEMSSSDIRKAKNDASLYDRAAKLKALLSDFSQMITTAEAYEEIPDDLTYDEFTEEQKSYAVDYYTLGILNSYQYNGESLVSFLTSSPSIKNLYPLASVMTDAQVVAAEYIGLWDALKYETINRYTSEKISESSFPNLIDQAIQENDDYIQDTYGEKEVTSIYFGVDREPFEGKIAITKDAMDGAVSSGDYSSLLSNDQLTKADLARFSAITASVVGIITTCIIKQRVKNASDVLSFNLSDVYDPDIIIERIQNKVSGKSRTMKIATGLQIAFALIMVAMSIWEAYELYKTFHPKYDKTNIPNAVFHSKINPDNGSTYYVRYRCVTDQNGDPSDVNGYAGSAYKILYTTKQVDAGEPLEAEVMKLCVENGASVSTDSQGYLGIHKPGYNLETNLNENVFNSSAPKIYIYFKQASENHIVASFFSGTKGTVAAGMIGFVLGGAVCALLTLLARKRRKGIAS